MVRNNDVVFLGSGSSSGIPLVHCLLGNQRSSTTIGGCSVCSAALVGDPKTNKNNRLNPSVILRFKNHSDGRTRHVLIDACKTFRESAMRWFPEHDIQNVDAVVLTHEHADAILGIDDLRMVQRRNETLPMYMSEKCYNQVSKAFDYLVTTPPKSVAKFNRTVNEKIQVTGKKPTFVAELSWNLIAKPEISEAETLPVFKVAGFEITTFPVYHGGDNLSLGFMVGRAESKKFVYISDVSSLPEAALTLLKSVSIELLVMDAVSPEQSYYSHQSAKEAIEIAELVRPKRVLLTGISHGIEHEKMNNILKKYLNQGIDIQLAHDGLVAELPGVVF